MAAQEDPKKKKQGLAIAIGVGPASAKPKSAPPSFPGGPGPSPDPDETSQGIPTDQDGAPVGAGDAGIQVLFCPQCGGAMKVTPHDSDSGADAGPGGAGAAPVGQ